MHMYLPVANRDMTPDRLGGHTNAQTTEIRRSTMSILGAPRGFEDLGRMAIFSGSWGALVIIFRDLGSKLIVLGI